MDCARRFLPTSLYSSLAVLVACSLPGLAYAQWYDYSANVDIMIKNQYVMAMESNLLTARMLEKKRKREASAAALAHTTVAAGAAKPASVSTVPASTALGFNASESVARDSRETYLAHLAKEDPATAVEYRQVLETQDVRGNFRKNLAVYGLDSSNLPDVLSAYWVILWAIANNERTDRLTPASVSAVQAAVRQEMASDPTALALSEQERQAVADLMMYDTVLADASYQNALREKRQDRVALLSDAVHERINEQGLDLRAIKLTRTGFKSR